MYTHIWQNSPPWKCNSQTYSCSNRWPCFNRLPFNEIQADTRIFASLWRQTGARYVTRNYLPLHCSYRHPITATTLADTPIAQLLHVYEDHLKIDLLSSWFMSKGAFYRIFLSPAGFSPVRTQLVSPVKAFFKWAKLSSAYTVEVSRVHVADKHKHPPHSTKHRWCTDTKRAFRLTLALIQEREDDSSSRTVGFWASAPSIFIQWDCLAPDASHTGVHPPSDTDE